MICDHKSVGILAWNSRRQLLLIERTRPPFGWAPPAGHLDNHGTFEEAARNEMKEEVGLVIRNLTLVITAKKENPCRRKAGTWHYWKVFQVQTDDSIQTDLEEAKQYHWCSAEEIHNLAVRTQEYLSGRITEPEWVISPGLEPIWREFFIELGILDACELQP